MTAAEIRMKYSAQNGYSKYDELEGEMAAQLAELNEGLALGLLAVALAVKRVADTIEAVSEPTDSEPEATDQCAYGPPPAQAEVGPAGSSVPRWPWDFPRPGETAPRQVPPQFRPFIQRS